MAIYIGLDASTQSLTAVAIEVVGDTRRVLFERSLRYDAAFPAYGTRNGVLPSADPRICHTPPLLWADALDRTMAEIASCGIDLSAIRAIAGSGQQHGSVYLRRSARARFAELDSTRALVDQIQDVFSRDTSPIWMDSSTTDECREIDEALGGPAAVARLTGSRAVERFTGPQIRRFARREAQRYADTDRIHLVSSFLASLLAGQHAPIDPGDGAGMNLMDIRSLGWAPRALAATAPGLDEKLPAIADAWSLVGTLSPYWRRRYGFFPSNVVIWSGDNPCSLVGVGISSERRLAISLGTSDTVFGHMREPRIDPSVSGHVFGAPTGGYMGLTCFANGSLARERIRDEYGLDWNGFSESLRTTPPGNDGAILLPWFEPEITPRVPVLGVRRCDLDPGDAAANVRAVVESQMLAMRRHSAWMGVQPDTIHATGGAATNREILQVAADIFSATVLRLDVSNAAALGAALRAFHADQLAGGEPLHWSQVMQGFTGTDSSERVLPRPQYRAVYDALEARHAACEADALRQP